MSLIIKMLKDLEERQNMPLQVPNVALLNHKRNILSFLKHFHFKLTAIVCILISAIALLSYMIVHKKNTLSLNFIPTHQNASVPYKISDESAWVQKVSIKGITFQIKENVTELSFLLNHPALYRLVSDGLQNKFSIIFDNADLQSEIPQINYFSSGIQNIEMHNIKGGIKFDIILAPNADIKLVNLNDNKDNAELNVAIELSKPTVDAQNNSSYVKTPALKTLLVQQYKAALQIAETGNYQSSIDQLKIILKSDPLFHDARTSLVALLIDQNQKKLAEGFIDQGIKLAPLHIPFIELKARIYADNGNPKLALALLQNYSPSMTDNPEYFAMIAALYEKTNKNWNAINLYKQLLNDNPQNGGLWFGLAMSLDKLGKSKDALAAYNKAIAKGQLNPSSLAYLQNRIQTLQEGVHETN